MPMLRVPPPARHHTLGAIPAGLCLCCPGRHSHSSRRAAHQPEGCVHWHAPLPLHPRLARFSCCAFCASWACSHRCLHHLGGPHPTWLPLPPALAAGRRPACCVGWRARHREKLCGIPGRQPRLHPAGALPSWRPHVAAEGASKELLPAMLLPWLRAWRSQQGGRHWCG
eukprot:scaffold110361_cov15-Tisochrysis_lutea.AAC.1